MEGQARATNWRQKAANGQSKTANGQPRDTSGQPRNANGQAQGTNSQANATSGQLKSASSQSKTTHPKCDLRARTKTFALRIVRLYSSLPRSTVAQVLGRQLLRSGTSVGAHYHEAHRASSTPEFVSKIEGGLQELDETTYWLELVEDAKLCDHATTRGLLSEAEELISIFVSSAKTAKKAE